MWGLFFCLFPQEEERAKIKRKPFLRGFSALPHEYYIVIISTCLNSKLQKVVRKLVIYI
ncbi:hypothetical protein FTV88_3014 [Heliorestis convoluta]|uniref:Uncharacterized protein n=1 Tax=Heliorestis convoluta TaxID=356322 RepID=A0A5Q2N5B6_9FIRM|nr:hypothetical protein FTV88_3014 [Heliorestis convoluta]